MSDPLTVPAGERGVIRLFALTIEAGGVAAFDAPGALDAALGVQGLDPDHIDVFAMSDLAGLGLANYLIDGCGVAEAVIEPDRDQLDARTGHIMAVRSRAFGGRAARITPAATLRLIGKYGETPVDRSGNGPLTSASARPGSGAPGPLPPRAVRARARLIGATILTAFFALICLIVLLLAF